MPSSDDYSALHGVLRFLKSKTPSGVKRLGSSMGRGVGTQILSAPPLRTIANRSYNRLGRRFRDLFVRAFSDVAITQDFLWTDSFLRRDILIPVSVNYHYSWNVALSCLWSEPGVRRLSELFVAAAPKDAVVFDVGANHGYVSYPFLASGLRCVLFEPQEVCIDFIRRTAELNSFSPVVETCVVSNAEGELDFIEAACPWLSKLAPASEAQGIATGQQAQSKTPKRVRAVTLDAYCARTGLRPSLVKIDVEGHEKQALDGAMEVVRRIRPVFSIELWQSPSHRSAIFELFHGAGYTCFQIGRRRYRVLRSGDELGTCPTPDFIFCPNGNPLIHALEQATY